MLLEVSDPMATSDHGVASGGSSEVGEIDRSGAGGNRWPRQETLALIKIRSDMDLNFRDSTLKGPLWEQVSRKLAELGFQQRSAKKCKEKFENVYKYHKRTKDGRSAKSVGKTYRFFDQLEALENIPPPEPIATAATPVSSISPTPLSVFPPKIVSNIPEASPQPQPQPLVRNPATFKNNSIPLPPIFNFQSSDSTSSSTSSDEDIHRRRRGSKRKWKDCFQRLMSEVIQKQEELQNKFLETLENRERDRMAREENWRVQEMTRINREHDRLVQERSIAAARDAAVIAFLQKVTDQHINLDNPPPHAPINPPEEREQHSPPPHPPPPPPQPQLPILPQPEDNGNGIISPSSSRWPKPEVQALIDLRKRFDLKYQENGPKGPLWEEISIEMGKLGYTRNAKRCKEKWENINKYFKKVKESNKKRIEDSKTCPYFDQLDALYKEKAIKTDPVPIMAMPEQQWPLSGDHHHPNIRPNENGGDRIPEDQVVEFDMIENKQMQ